MGVSDVLSTLWKYSACITFPTLSFAAIFADWNHTRKWKASQKVESISEIKESEN
ncbi:uncharacterized protein LOC142329081 [Lycorma delicatula]|uniref:uncharacterized protein LOC142329081 n=1 Tax=Lycorma delicatula TaxID=130591 RepID=UPI003F50E848